MGRDCRADRVSVCKDRRCRLRAAFQPEEYSPTLMRIRKPMVALITLSGIDGTGKSTVALAIKDFLRAQYGMPSRHIWCKFGKHPLTRLKLGRSLATNPLELNETSSHSHSTALLPFRRVYIWSLLGFHLLELATSVRRSLQQGQSVICDRFIYDTMVDLWQEARMPLEQSASLFDQRWIPCPTAKFLLDLPATQAFARKPDSASVGFLEERRVLYLTLAEHYQLMVIDTSQRIEQVLETVLGQVEQQIQPSRRGWQ